MKSLGQFCSIARALEILGERWSLLVVRELLCGSETFGDIQRGIPRISRTMLSARLRELCDAGILTRGGTQALPVYRLTPSGQELAPIVMEIGRWGQRWLSREFPVEQMDIDALLWDMQRRVCKEKLPVHPFVIRFEVLETKGKQTRRFMLMRKNEVSLCSANAGFPEKIEVRTPSEPLFAWWRGDIEFATAQQVGLKVTSLQGSATMAKAFPNWFSRYVLADVSSVST
jgi:DNA-binding HxlR family transcriptional regulator